MVRHWSTTISCCLTVHWKLQPRVLPLYITWSAAASFLLVSVQTTVHLIFHLRDILHITPNTELRLQDLWPSFMEMTDSTTTSSFRNRSVLVCRIWLILWVTMEICGMTAMWSQELSNLTDIQPLMNGTDSSKVTAEWVLKQQATAIMIIFLYGHPAISISMEHVHGKKKQMQSQIQNTL